MKYILVFLLGMLASAKMSFQSAFGKKSVKNSIDALSFNIFVFIASAILFMPRVFNCSPAVWMFGAVGAVFTVMFQLTYTKALTVGNVSLTVLITNFSMVINVIVSCLIFGESISFVRFISIVITVISFMICSGVRDGDMGDKKWLMYTIIAMISTSCCSRVQKFLSASVYSGENQAYVSCLYICSAIIGLIVYPIIRKKEKRNFRIDFSLIKYAAAVGICLGVYQLIYTYGLANIDGTFLFPAQTGGTIIFSALSGVLIFKDRFSKRQVVGILLGIISLVMMNF